MTTQHHDTTESNDDENAARFGSANLDRLIDHLITELTQTFTPAAESGWTDVLVAFAYTDPVDEDPDANWHEGLPDVAIWWGTQTHVFNLADDHADLTQTLPPTARDLLTRLASARPPAMVDWNLLTFRLTPAGDSMVRTAVAPYREFNAAQSIKVEDAMVQLLNGNLHVTT